MNQVKKGKWLTEATKIWEAAPELGQDEGYSLILPAGTSWKAISKAVLEGGQEEMVVLFTTPLGGIVEETKMFQGVDYMCPEVRYLRVIRDAADIVYL